jgi:hypothetical protein
MRLLKQFLFFLGDKTVSEKIVEFYLRILEEIGYSDLSVKDIVNTKIGSVVGNFNFNNGYNETFQIDDNENFSISSDLEKEIVHIFKNDWDCEECNFTQSFTLLSFIIYGFKTEDEGIVKNAIRLMMYLMWNRQFNKYNLSHYGLNELEFHKGHKLTIYKNSLDVINEELSIRIYDKFSNTDSLDKYNTKKLYQQIYHRVKMTVLEFAKKLNVSNHHNYVKRCKYKNDVNGVIDNLNKHDYSSNSEVVQCLSLLNKILNSK